MNKIIMMAGAFALAVSLGGCVSTASFVASAATNLSSSTPSQVATFEKATKVADDVTKLADAAVLTGKVPKPVLRQLAALANGLHEAWVDLKEDKDAGRSLAFGAFNAALSVYRAYATSEGIAQ